MAGPLAGTRVLEMASFISGPYAGMLLADLGADVVKVEQPGTGDPFRGWGEREGKDTPQFAAYNRGKRSVTLDLQSAAGREAYQRLAGTSDVVIENFRPGTAERLGIGYEVLEPLNPRIVYCAITGRGSTGPQKNRPTYDAIAQAITGLWSVLIDMAEPRPVGPPLSDQLTGLYAAYGILAALAARSASGAGQRLEVSMLSATMAFLTEPVANYLHDGEISTAASRPRRSLSFALAAADGLPLAIHLSSPPKFWEGLTAVLGREDLREDARFSSRAQRVRNYEALHAELASAIRARPRAEWLALLEQNDVPAAPINNVAEALADSQVEHLRLVREFGEGDRRLPLVGFPVQFAQTDCLPGLPPPRLGEHTDEVLVSLGYDSAALHEMRANAVT